MGAVTERRRASVLAAADAAQANLCFELEWKRSEVCPSVGAITKRLLFALAAGAVQVRLAYEEQHVSISRLIAFVPVSR